MGGNGKPFRGRGRGGWRGNRGNRGHRGNGGFRGHRGGGGRGHPAASRGRGPPFNKKFPQVLGPRLAEVDVGITEFISQHDGFPAVMKQRFSDFMVNEIDIDGNVVKLTSLDPPVEADEDNTKADRHELIPEEIWMKLVNLSKSAPKNSGKDKKYEKNSNLEVHERTDTGSSEKLEEKKNTPGDSNNQTVSSSDQSSAATEEPQCVEFDVTSLDKDGRRAIHNCVKKAFKDLNSNTTEKDGNKYVVFSLGKSLRDKQNRGKWPESRSGEYLYFVVHKRNMDTTETVNEISSRLRMRPNNITFAGTKDKRGITSQLMSIRYGEPSRLNHLSKGLFNVVLGNFCFKKNPLRLGDLKGNQFKIALRNVQGSDEQINAGLESLKNNGFINYYGLQRFGTNKNVPTHSVGKALLQGEWKKAVDLILEPREGFVHLKEALDQWKTNRNAKEALEKLRGPSNCLEALLLKGLDRHGPNDFVNALSMIPLNTQLMYVHAYQSLTWNKAVSQRVKEFGLKPIVGDLVLIKSEKVSSSDNTANENTLEIVDSSIPEAIEALVEEKSTKQEVKCLTEKEIENYKIDDVVLPLPGYDVEYPNNSIGIYIKDLLKEDGLTSESLQHQVKRFAVRGTYRPMIARAGNVSWNIVHYSHSESDFILSDFEELKGKDAPKDEPDGKYKAIVLSMDLPSSTYATMAVREITKTDTSAVMQASISASAAESSKDSEEVSAIVKEDADVLAEDTNKKSMEIVVDAPVADSEEGFDGSNSDLSNTHATENVDLKRKAEEMTEEVVSEKKKKET